MAEETPAPTSESITEISVKRGEQFLALSQGLVDGFVGLLHYRAFLASADVALAKLALIKNTLAAPQEVERLLAILDDDSRIHFERLSRCLILVHSVALIDAFISDATELLLMMHAEALGDSEIKLGELVKLRSIEDAVTASIKRKVRTISSDSFAKRLQFIRRKFGLAIEVTEEQFSALDKYVDLRNRVIHNWGPWELRWSRRGPMLEGIVGATTKIQISDEIVISASDHLMKLTAAIVLGIAPMFGLSGDQRLQQIASWLMDGSPHR